jgi:hypothetical protein
MSSTTSWAGRAAFALVAAGALGSCTHKSPALIVPDDRCAIVDTVMSARICYEGGCFPVLAEDRCTTSLRDEAGLLQVSVHEQELVNWFYEPRPLRGATETTCQGRYRVDANVREGEISRLSILLTYDQGIPVFTAQANTEIRHEGRMKGRATVACGAVSQGILRRAASGWIAAPIPEELKNTQPDSQRGNVP